MWPLPLVAQWLRRLPGGWGENFGASRSSRGDVTLFRWLFVARPPGGSCTVNDQSQEQRSIKPQMRVRFPSGGFNLFLMIEARSHSHVVESRSGSAQSWCCSTPPPGEVLHAGHCFVMVRSVGQR